MKAVYFSLSFKIPDKDLEVRRIGQRIDPTTGEMFTKDIYDPDKAPVVVRKKLVY